MALSITINKVAVADSFAAGTKVADIVVSGGTSPYSYSLASGGDYFQIEETEVRVIADMNIDNIQSFSVFAEDSTSGEHVSGVSEEVYPNITAKIQSRFNSAGKIYKITQDIDLGHGVLTIPSGCTLDFQGGSFSNGTIVGNYTVIRSGICIIFKDINCSGTFQVDKSYLEWFSYTGDNSHYNNKHFKNAFTLGAIQLLEKTYIVSEPINLLDNHYVINGEVSRKTIITTDSNIETIFNIMQQESSIYDGTKVIRNVTINGRNLANFCIKCSRIVSESVIENVSIIGAIKVGLYVAGSWYAQFNNITILNCNVGLQIEGISTSSDISDTREDVNCVVFNGVYSAHNTTHAVYIKGHYGYGLTFIGCTFENSTNGSNLYIENAQHNITLIGCYSEGKNISAIEFVTSSNAFYGVLSVLGGSYTHSFSEGNTKPIFNIGEISQLTVIGSTVITFLPPYPEYYIYTLAKYNYITFSGAGGDVASISNVYAKYGASGYLGKTDGEDKQFKVVDAEKIAAVGRYTPEEGNVSPKIEISYDRPSTDNYEGIIYKFYFNFNREISNTENKLELKYKRYGKEGDEEGVFGYVDNAGNFYFSKVIGKGGIQSSPISWDSLAMFGGTEGELRYDSTNKRYVLWNGTTWVNMDGTSLEGVTALNNIEEIPASEDKTN